MCYSREEAIADVTSAIQFHVETFGATELETGEPLQGVFVADTNRSHQRCSHVVVEWL
jgi:predicted RNase H-like HicB family nuclease